jgi:nucleoside-diphosphate-sugar epimerase
LGHWQTAARVYACRRCGRRRRLSAASLVGEPINVGTGEDIGIAELAETIARIVGFKGRFAFDLSKPDGAPRKALDASKLLALGWRAKIGFDQGIRETYRWFCEKDRAGGAILRT